MGPGMDPNLLQPSSGSDPDSNESVGLSCSDSLPLSNESDPKRQKIEGEVKSGESDQHGDGDGDGDMKEGNGDEEDCSDEIEDEDDDDEDDAMEVQQCTPIAHTLLKEIDEDDEGLQRYIRNMTESEGFDLDENPLLEYQQFVYAIHKVDFQKANHAHHAEYIQRCLDHVIAEQAEKGNVLKSVKLEKANYGLNMGYDYYITFAADNDEGHKVYQVEVNRSIWKEVAIHVFREKPVQQQNIAQV